VEVINHIKTKGAPDLLVIDIEMNILGGIATATRIRDMGYESIPMIFVSEKADRDTVLQCKALKAKEFMIKPVRPTYFKERVAVALGIQQER